MKKIALIFLSLLLVSCSKPTLQQQYSSLNVEKAVYIKNIDGDTLTVLYNGVTSNVRLIGVDTPESKKNAKAKSDALKQHVTVEQIVKQGKEAYTFTSSLMKKNDEVFLEFDKEKTDKYKRLLAYVYLNNTMINSTLVKDGYAVPMSIKPNVKYAKQFKEQYTQAVKEKKGLWK